MSNRNLDLRREVETMRDESEVPDLPYKAWVRSFGVDVCIRSDSVRLLEDAVDRAKKALVGNLEVVQECSTPHQFGLFRDPDGVLVLHQDGNNSRHSGEQRYFLKFFDSMLRIKVAEYAVDRVFLHAGVVGWKGKAIVFPGDSFHGKSTLAAEFVKAGADYYSDEYAVLDSKGLVHPFPRSISMRSRESIDEPYEISEISAESLGGKIGCRPLPVGCVLITKYKDDAAWEPQILSPGEAVIEIISQTIPIRYDPQFSLNVLKKITSNAILLKCFRNDASKFARSFLDFVDKDAVSAKMFNTYSI